MKKKLILTIICLFVSVLAWAGDKKESNVISSQFSDKLQGDTDEIVTLKSKVSDLELTSDLRYKHYDEILEAQRFGYTINVTILIAMLAGFIALIVFINFNFIKGELSRDTENSVLEVKKELATTTQELRKNFNDATQDLRKEFNQQVLDSIKNVSIETDKRFKEIEHNFEEKTKWLAGNNFNALGRIYENTKAYGTSALWYARGLAEYLEADLNEDWLKLQIRNVQFNLVKCEASGLDEENFKELEDIIKLIPDEKFKKEKEELMSIFMKTKQTILNLSIPSLGTPSIIPAT